MPLGRLREAMNGKENPLELLVMCAVIVVLSLLGVAGGLMRGLFGSLDGLLMLAVCLMMALIFGILLLVLARDQGWLGRRGKKDDSAAAVSAKGK